MARPRVEVPAAEEIARLADSDGRLSLRVTPGARSETIMLRDGVVHVKTRAKPHDGAANDAVIRLLAAALSIAPSQIELQHGATSRNKLVKLSL
ncbi:DUF167 domain-containing protein [Altererythrobacter sp. Z27]|uniref:DUF167 domain-containing protein n=1 Tax=Altererythrobacter sp. Z27 TaxID=3461147 RepID=UPI0040448686